MSASGNTTVVRGLSSGTEEICKILVFYEDAPARMRAMSVCERVADQFAEDLDFEFRWWKFKRLVDPAMMQEAVHVATDADIVMFCAQGAELPCEAVEWLENWVESGSRSDGALALVLAKEFALSTGAEKSISRLKWAAQRLGMDFLHLPAPALKENAAKRAAEPTPLPPHMMIVERPHAYHWGLNE